MIYTVPRQTIKKMIVGIAKILFNLQSNYLISIFLLHMLAEKETTKAHKSLA